MSTSGSIAARALLAVLLMVGFYVLAIGIAAALVYLPYGEWRLVHRITPKLAVLCLMGAGIILWAIVPRPDRFVPPGPELRGEQQPRLFDVLRQIAGDAGEEMPAEVYLVPQVNAWVAQRGGAMGLGSRRVMGLGFPLLQRLSVAELRAVLAHEFGHYHGGDTMLGPWVYKTRAAIGRTIVGLARRDSILQVPFVAYGKMFLRLTHAVSRRQELAADQLAVRVAGAPALANGLRTIHGAGPAFAAFWQTEMLPVLSAGLRPPLAEGFQRFVEAGRTQEIVARSLGSELAEGRSDPYDTHPSLRERLQALGAGAETTAPPAPHAITLLDRVSELEAQLLAGIAGESAARALRAVSWEDVGAEVYIPLWRRFVGRYAWRFEGWTCRRFPEVTGDLDAFAQWFDKNVPAAKRAAHASTVLGALLALALHHRGWSPRTQPGEDFVFERDGGRMAPFDLVRRLAAGELGAEEWQGLCRDAGVVDVDLGLLARPGAGAGGPA